MAVSANETLSILNSSSGPGIVHALQTNTASFRSVLSAVDNIQLASHALSPIQHVFFTPSKEYQIVATTTANVSDEEKVEAVLDDVCEDALVNGVFVTVARHLRGQESDIGALSAGVTNTRVAPGGASPPTEPRASIKVAISAALSKKETEKAALVLKNSINRVLKRRT